MKNKILITGLLLFFAINGYSQHYVDGYVIKESGDTIFGKIGNLSPEQSCLKIKFKDFNGNKIKFKDEEVYAYKIGADLYFKKPYGVPTMFDNMIGFMRLINDGKVKLYEFRFQAKSNMPMGSNGGMGFGTSQFIKHHYLEKNGEFIRVPKRRFKQTMSKYFSDSQVVVDKIKQRYYTYEEIEALVRMYNTYQY